MKLKTNVEIVTGFLGSGKTRFINALLNDTVVQGERVIVIQCESGKSKVELKFQHGSEIAITECNLEKPISNIFLQDIINFYKPHRIIIEHNGSTKIDELLMLFYEKKLLSICKITSIFHILDAITFKMFIENMGNLLLGSIHISDLIIVNNTGSIPKEKTNEIIHTLEKMNNHGYIITLPDISTIRSVLREKNILHKGIAKKIDIAIKNLIFKYTR